MAFSARQYDPETRRMLSAVLDDAWERLKTEHLQTSQAENVADSRAELERRIAEAYAEGEREPATLKLLALRAFNRWLQV
jgi:hypothetical protein